MEPVCCQSASDSAFRRQALFAFVQKEMAMDFQLRTVTVDDYEAIAEIVNRVESPWKTTREETQQEDIDPLAAGGTVLHYVAVEMVKGQVVGQTVLRGWQSSAQPQRYHLELRVDPNWQRRGIGTLLWQQTLEVLQTMNWTTVRVWVRDCYPQAIDFATRCGFVTVSHNGPWRLTVAEVDLEPFRPCRERLVADNIVLTTLAEQRDSDPQCLAKLHQLRVAVDADIPVAEPYPSPDFADFVREMESPNALPDAVFIARFDTEYIGLSCLSRNSAEPDTLNQTITGVRSDWRHRGIAIALKVQGIEYARRQGFTSIVTYMDSVNTPMRTLNEKMGFRPGIGAVLMERQQIASEYS